MTKFLEFELVPFDEDLREMDRITIRKSSESAARAHAGRIAKINGGPVDLARAGSDDWNERYLTTASPSEFHATGYRFERLAG